MTTNVPASSTDEVIIQIPLDQLHDSPSNPRQTYRETGLQELATDIRTIGRIVQPLLVRPRVPVLFQDADDPNAIAGYEIVFGHRRKRAGQLAGLTTGPCMVRAMTDAEVARAQISENLQREDVHPFEEAQGYQALIGDHSETPDSIAEQTGKSRSYIYGRLKLLAACQQVRDACINGEIGAEVALLIARLRTVKLQEKALGYIKAEWRAKLDDGGKASFRAIRDLLNEKFTLELKSAIFDVDDETLLSQAGPCSKCPRRSGNAPEYSDIVDAKDAHPFAGMLKVAKEEFGYLRHKGADVCTDPDCFDEKKKAHLKREADKLVAAGKAVVAGNAARSAISAVGEIKGAFIALKDVKADIKGKGVQVLTIQDPRTGKTHQAVKIADAKAAGVKVKEPKKAAPRYDYEAERKKREEEERKRDALWKVEQSFRYALLARVRDAIASTPRSTFDLQLIAGEVWKCLDWHLPDHVAALWGEKNGSSLGKTIGSMTADQASRLMLDCALVDHVFGHSGHLDRQPENLLRAAKHYAVDVDQLRAELAGAASTPPPAARAPKRATPAKPAKDKAPAARALKKASGAAAAAAEERTEEIQTDDAGCAGEQATTSAPAEALS